MKAVYFDRYGPPNVLELRDIKKPCPKDNEVLIKTCAATVVAGDCEIRSFKFPVLWFWLPLRLYAGLFRPKRVNVLGQELAGEIVEVGSQVKRFRRGDQVFATPGIGLGAHAEFKCMSEDQAIALKPANMTFEEAAAVPTGGLNALHFLRKAHVQPGDKVLINGAAGTIGSFAVQLAKYFGAEVSAVDSADKLDMLRSIGATHVIDYAEEDFTKSGEKYDVIFDLVATSSFSRCVKSLNKNGRYIIANPRLSSMVRGFWTSKTSDKQVIFEFASDRAEDLNFLKELIEAGHLKSVIDRSYPLGEMAEAHRFVESGQKVGNVAISVAQANSAGRLSTNAATNVNHLINA